MEYKFALTQLKLLQKSSLRFNLACLLYKTSFNARFYCSTGTDRLLEHLMLEVGGKQDRALTKYFEQFSPKALDLPPETRLCPNEVLYPLTSNIPFQSELTEMCDVKDLVRLLERNINYEDIVPDESLRYLLVYFAKNGNISGVKAVQLIVKKYNFSHFTLQSGYDHYLAEALWINGKVEDSLKLFVSAFDNTQLRNKIKVMLSCLFPLLVAHHGESTVRKTIYAMEKLSSEKDDHILLACLWKELFQSTWFSDQQLSKQILQQNPNLDHIIRWMIPSMGKDLLKSHRIEDFYRLIEFTLENKLQKYEGLLLRLLFDYYYIHKNIERCSAVIKYSSNGESPLTEEQLKRYINLLVKSKDSETSKRNVKTPQNIKYKF